MGEHQGEGGVVADRADVAEMIGEPLELGHHAAQGVRARRRLDAERRLDRAGEGDRVGDRRIAADPPREPGRALEARPAHQRVDAFVGVAEPLLEPHDRLAAGVEAEMAGLDDPGMDRTDRNLMQARALWPRGRRRRPARRPWARGRRADGAAASGRGRASGGRPARRAPRSRRGRKPPARAGSPADAGRRWMEMRRGRRRRRRRRASRRPRAAPGACGLRRPTG